MTSTDIPDGFSEAERAFQSGDLSRATQLLQRCVAAAPRHAGSRFGLAMCHLQLRRPMEARRLFEDTLQIDPSHVYARQQLSLLATCPEREPSPMVPLQAGVVSQSAPGSAGPYAPSPI
jgi:hypothetical protein